VRIGRDDRYGIDAVPTGLPKELELAPADDQHDRIATPLDRAGPRALADHTADSPRASAPHPADRAVALSDLALRSSEA
jgi:hypothetical protein